MHKSIQLFLAAAACSCLLNADSVFEPGNLVVSRSEYAGTASTVTIGEPLPPNCPITADCGSGKATDNGAYPVVGSNNNVFNNDLVDGSFGVTSPIFLDEISTTSGNRVSTFAVPASYSTSFPSKSELALNLTDDRSAITFMAYGTGPNQLDVSNSNTPGVYDPTNPAGSSVYRLVVEVNSLGGVQATESNAYSGNNGRAAVRANGLYFTVGNSNNGSGTPANVVAAAGAQYLIPGAAPGAPQPVGNFSITQVTDPSTGKPYAPDKAGKDNNFRGLTVFNNTLYITKGSGGNGINTVYQVGQSGTLPSPATAATTPITILPGFPTTLAKNAGAQNPFGLFFANANTLYVADEGDGTVANAATSPNAGLQKWVLTNGVWRRVYVLQAGLNLGVPYAVDPRYPANLNPATDGLRNITGRVNSDGSATIWAITSTVSSNGDQGADPNRVVRITDVIANTDPTAAAGEQFTTVREAQYNQVYRGVSFTPGTSTNPAPANFSITTSAISYNRITRIYTGSLTVTNNAASPFTAPVIVSLDRLPFGVTLTSGPNPVTVSQTGLAPGQSITVPLTFADPNNAQITFNPVVTY